MAKAKTKKRMTTTSIYIEEELLKRLQYSAGQAGTSLVISLLAEKWLRGDVIIELPPKEEE